MFLKNVMVTFLMQGNLLLVLSTNTGPGFDIKAFSNILFPLPGKMWVIPMEALTPLQNLPIQVLLSPVPSPATALPIASVTEIPDLQAVTKSGVFTTNESFIAALKGPLQPSFQQEVIFGRIKSLILALILSQLQHYSNHH